MKNLLIYSFLFSLVAVGCRDKSASKAEHNRNATLESSEIIELEKEADLNIENQKDIDETVKELDALLEDIDQ